MKKSIIEEIYRNNESLGEQIVMSEEYKKVSDESYECYKKLLSILNDEQKKMFKDFADLLMGVCAEGEFSHFKHGLKVGLLLAMECLI